MRIRHYGILSGRTVARSVALARASLRAPVLDGSDVAGRLPLEEFVALIEDSDGEQDPRS